MTFAERLEVTQGRSTGFDYIRITLAVAVIAFHTVLVVDGEAASHALWSNGGRLFYVVVPSFFALSGFLVAGSWERVNSIPIFVTLRVLRILPALTFDILLSALLLGPLLTNVDLTTYVSSEEFRAYFLNIAGDIHYRLPGVFTDHPIPDVNRQLWTVPFELKCYLIMIALGAATVLKWRHLTGLMALAFNIFAYVYNRKLGLTHDWGGPTGTVLVSSFLWGVYLYVGRSSIPFRGWMALVCLLVTAASLSIGPGWGYLGLLPTAYLTVYLGLLNPRKILLLAASDLSYGLYLYGFPIQQAVWQLLPSCRVWYLNFLISLPIALGVAWVSWTFLESKVLAQKRHVIAAMLSLGTMAQSLRRPPSTLRLPR